MPSDLPFRVTTVHVEELFAAFNRHNLAVHQAMVRSKPELANTARAEFKKFCEDHHLPVSFVERDVHITKET